MADALKSEFRIEPEMIAGAGGVFDIKVDGQLIYSKHETGEFPENSLIVERIAAKTA